MPIFIAGSNGDIQAPETSPQCPICHNDIGTNAMNDSKVEMGIILACGHTFGHVCLAKWLDTRQSSAGSKPTSCPTCRREIQKVVRGTLRIINQLSTCRAVLRPSQARLANTNVTTSVNALAENQAAQETRERTLVRWAQTGARLENVQVIEMLEQPGFIRTNTPRLPVSVPNAPQPLPLRNTPRPPLPTEMPERTSMSLQEIQRHEEQAIASRIASTNAVTPAVAAPPGFEHLQGHNHPQNGVSSNTYAPRFRPPMPQPTLLNGVPGPNYLRNLEEWRSEATQHAQLQVAESSPPRIPTPPRTWSTITIGPSDLPEVLRGPATAVPQSEALHHPPQFVSPTSHSIVQAGRSSPLDHAIDRPAHMTTNRGEMQTLPEPLLPHTVYSPAGGMVSQQQTPNHQRVEPTTHITAMGATRNQFLAVTNRRLEGQNMQEALTGFPNWLPPEPLLTPHEPSHRRTPRYEMSALDDSEDGSEEI